MARSTFISFSQERNGKKRGEKKRKRRTGSPKGKNRSEGGLENGIDDLLLQIWGGGGLLGLRWRNPILLVRFHFCKPLFLIQVMFFLIPSFLEVVVN